MADDTDRLRDGNVPGGPYPILTSSAANEPIAIVGTDGNYRYVGRLVVGFDETGVLLPESIDAEVSGAFAADERGVVEMPATSHQRRVSLKLPKQFGTWLSQRMVTFLGIRAFILMATGIPFAQNGEVVGDMNQSFRVATLNFLAGGGDDCPYPNFPNTDRADLPTAMTEEQSGGQATFAAPGTEQDALAEYLAANFSETPFAAADVGPEGDERIQNLAFRTDSLIVPPPTATTFDTQLSAGLNMISLPLMPDEPYTARSFMEKLDATIVIEYNPSVGRFIGFTANSSGDGFPIEGGKGYIVSVSESKIVSFTGRAWENTPAMVAAAPTPAQVSHVWAFVLHARFEGVEDLTLTVHNERTGIIRSVDVNESHAIWADMSSRAVASVGDRLAIEVRNTTGELIRTLHHEIDVTDTRRAFAELRLTPDDLKPRRTALLANHPNPFNPETWMPYQLANDTDVAIHIYTPTGHLVRHLDLGFKSAGYYIGRTRAAYWDGRNDFGERLASGVYFYQLITPESTAIRRMVIVKQHR